MNFIPTKNKSSIYRHIIGRTFFCLLIAFVCLNKANSQTALSPGDVAIVGFDANTDSVAILLLKNIDLGTELKITDHGWSSGDNDFYDYLLLGGSGDEQHANPSQPPHHSWLAGRDYFCGEVIRIKYDDGDTDDELDPNNDQLIVFTGTFGAYNHITAVNFNGPWSDATDENSSALPPDLTNGINAMSLPACADAIYAGSCDLLDASQLFNQSNYTRDSSPNNLVSCNYYFQCCTLPTQPISGSISSNISKTSADINFTINDGDSVLVLARQGSSIDNISFGIRESVSNANTSFGSGDELRPDVYAVYQGNANNFTLSNLSPGLEYTLAFYPMNGTDGPCYKTSDRDTLSFTTLQTQVKFSVLTDLDKSEGDADFDVCVSIENESTSQATTVDLSIDDNSRLVAFNTQTLTFPANDNTPQCVTINIDDNTDCDGYESFLFSLENVNGGDNAIEKDRENERILNIDDNEAVPTTQASVTSSTNILGTTADINIEEGNGTGTLVVIRPSSSPITLPSNSANYTANTSYGNGSVIGSGFVIFLNDITNTETISISNLSPGESYAIDVFEYFSATPPRCYNTTDSSSLFSTQILEIEFSSNTFNANENDGTTSLSVNVLRNELTSNANAKIVLDLAEDETRVDNFIDEIIEFTAGNLANVDSLINITDNVECGDDDALTFTLENHNLDDRIVINTNTTTLNINSDDVPPVDACTNATTSSLQTNQVTLNWDKANSSEYTLVVLYPNSPSVDHPELDETFNANSTYGAGDALGNGFVVYNGNANSTTVTGLTELSNYTAYFYPFNASSCYNTNSPLTLNFTTLQTYFTFKDSALTLTEDNQYQICVQVKNNFQAGNITVDIDNFGKPISTSPSTLTFNPGENEECFSALYSNGLGQCEDYTDSLMLLGLTNISFGDTASDYSYLKVLLQDDELLLPATNLVVENFNNTNNLSSNNPFRTIGVNANNTQYLWNVDNENRVGVAGSSYFGLADPVYSGGFSTDFFELDFFGNSNERDEEHFLYFNQISNANWNNYKNITISWDAFSNAGWDASDGEFAYALDYTNTGTFNFTPFTGNQSISIPNYPTSVTLAMRGTNESVADDDIFGIDNLIVSGQECTTCGNYTNVGVSNISVTTNTDSIKYAQDISNAGVLIVVSKRPIVYSPINGTDYSAQANSNINSAGTLFGIDHYIIYDGTNDFTEISGLDKSLYYGKIFPYKSLGGFKCYLNDLAYSFTFKNNVNTYYYNAGGNGRFNFQNITDWLPTRAIPDDGDRLIFNSGHTLELINLVDENLAYLEVSNNTDVTLTKTAATGLFEIDTLIIESGSKLTLENIDVEMLGSASYLEISGELNLGDYDLEALNRVTIKDGGILRFDGGSFTVGDEVTDFLIIEDNAQLIQGTGSIISGDASSIVYRQTGFAGNTTSHWSSPYSNGQDLNDDLTGEYVWIYKNGEDDNEDYLRIPGTLSIEQAKGYTVYNAKDISFSENADKLGNGDVNISFTHDADTDTDTERFYLVGNPYPSAISAFEFLTHNVTNNDILGTIYVFSQQNSFGSYNREADNIAINLMGSSTAPQTNNISDVYDFGDFFIASCQGFFVVKDIEDAIDADESETCFVEFNNSMRGGSSNNFKSGNSPIHYRFWLMINDDNNYNTCLLGFADDATLDNDNLYDSPHIPSENGLGVYTGIKNTDYLIQGLPPVEDVTARIPVTLTVPNAGEYDLSIVASDGFPEDKPVYLFDAKRQRYYNLQEENYTHVSSSKEVIKDRYYLQFKGRGKPVNILESTEKLCGDNFKEVLINDASLLQSSKLYSLDGRLIEDSTPEKVNEKLEQIQGTAILKLYYTNGMECDYKIVR